MNVHNISQDPNSLQVSWLKDMPAGNWKGVPGSYPVLVKNITQDEVLVQVKLCKGDDFVTTVLYPGWNPELIVAINNVPANTLQYGN